MRCFTNNLIKTGFILVLVMISAITLAALINTFTEGLGLIPGLSASGADPSIYGGLLSDRVFLQALCYSFLLALVSVILCFILGIMMAHFLCSFTSPIIHASLRLPILLSYVAASLLMYNTLNDHGLCYHILKLAGFNISGLDILFKSNGAGVILLNCFKGIPFLAASVYPVLQRTVSVFDPVCYNLGASETSTYLKIVFPLIKRPALSAALVIFCYQMFCYESFYFLGASRPVSLGIYAMRLSQTSDLFRRAEGMAVNFVMILISFAASIAYLLIMKREERP